MKLAWAVLALIVARASTAAADETIARARAALEDQRYEDAMAIAGRRLDGTDLEARADALALLAEALLLEGRPVEAARFVQALYEMAPAFELKDPSLPPRVTEPFAAEAAHPHTRAVAITIHPKDHAGYEIDLSFAAHVDLACRPSDAAPYAPVSLIRVTGAKALFVLPTASRYWCFAIASDDAKLPLGRLGGPEAPVAVSPAPAGASPSLATRWWFWTAAGAVAAGTVAVVYAATRPHDVSLPPAGATSSGTVQKSVSP